MQANVRVPAVVLCLFLFALSFIDVFTGAASAQSEAGAPWQRHTIDASSHGADGVRLFDIDGDGLMDIATGWEQGGVVRVCINPGAQNAKEPWPSVTVGEGASPEDAVIADLDGDGTPDVVSCHEGKFKRVLLHFHEPADVASGPELGRPTRTPSFDLRREGLLQPDQWTTVTVEESVDRTRWMYAIPMQVDGVRGIDLVVGSKEPCGTVGWLQSPENPRDGSQWKYHPIVPAGWIMTLDVLHDDPPSLVVTDRKGKHRGVYRLDLIDTDAPQRAESWKRTDLGGRQSENMFAALLPPDNEVLLSSSRHGHWFAFSTGRDAAGGAITFENPLSIESGKAIAATEYGANRVLLAHTSNTGNDQKANQVPGVAWAIVDREQLNPNSNQRAKSIKWYAMSDTEGVKFDRGEWLDVDADGDEDFITCEERDNLGVFWYENPER